MLGFHHRRDQDKCGDHYLIEHGHEGQVAPDLCSLLGVHHRAIQMSRVPRYEKMDVEVITTSSTHIPRIEPE